MKYHYCYHCGTPTTSLEMEGYRRAFCPQCQLILYENPLPTVVIIAYNEQNEIVLIRRAVEPGRGGWSLPGGFIEIGETTAQAAVRELLEETGLSATELKLVDVGTHLNGFYGDILMIGYATPVQEDLIRPGSDAAEAAWFKIDDHPSLVFPFHEKLIENWRMIK
ncbi:MAG TPA: NUDIX hydrolase [Candidatus Marinimicrobia bacterium]|nr:NUDIX hydrolase [Candidatus Neomarinimicrobiota bacterium]